MADPRARVILEAKRRGDGAFKTFDADLKRIATRAGLVGAAATAAFAAVTKASFETIDNLAKTGDKLGILPDQLAGLQLAAEQSGVGIDKFNMGLQRMVRRIAEVATFGRGEAIPALDALGLSAEQLVNLPVEEQFRQIGEAMQGVENQAQRVSIGFKLFDSEGVDLIRTLEGGRESLDAFQAEAERLGLAVSRVDAAKIEQAVDAMNLLKRAVTGAANSVAIELAPAVTAIADAFRSASTDAVTMRDVARGAIDSIAVGVGIVADAYRGWEFILSLLKVSWLDLQVNITGGMAVIQEAAHETRQFLERLVPGDPLGDLKRELVSVEQGMHFVSRSSDDWAELSQRAEELREQIAEMEAPDIVVPLRRATMELEVQRSEALAAARALSQSEMPSEVIAANLMQARLEADEAAAATAALREEMLGAAATNLGNTTPEEQRAQQAAEAAAAASQRELQRVIDLVSSKETLEMAAFERRKQIVEDAVSHEIIERARANEIIASLEQQKNINLQQIAREQLLAGVNLTREQLAAELGTLDEAQTLRQEREREWLTSRLELLRAGLEQEFLTEQEFREASVAAHEESQARITAITEAGFSEREKFAAKSSKAQTQQVLGSLIQMTQGVASTNKAMFRINKLAAVANAVINTAQGVTRALAEYPPPLSFAMAAAQAAAGAAQISAIKSTSFGGGTTPSVAGAAPAANNIPVSPEGFFGQQGGGSDKGGLVLDVTVQGSVVGMGGAEELVDFIQESLRERLEDRDEVIFTQNSRQGTVGAA